MKDQKAEVGAVHAAPIYMKKIETLQKVVSLIEEAGKQNVELLAFPEVFVPGFPVGTLFPS
jgi:nitrilase